MGNLELSSNWKRLQQRIPNSSQGKATGTNGTALGKRRRDLDPTTTSAVAYKRIKSMGATPPQPVPQDPEPIATSTPAATNVSAGKYIALDCEMVGTTDVTPLAIASHNRDAPPNAPREYSILARASLVDFNGSTIYDAYVLPPPNVRITDYRTKWSGITPSHLALGNMMTKPKPFSVVQKEVFALLQGRVLVGHAIKNDLEVLGLSHPKRDIRDTSRHPKFRQLAATEGRNGKPGKARTPSLKRLANEILGLQIQMGPGHSSEEDARATMLLFKREKAGFEEEAMKTFGRRPPPPAVKTDAKTTPVQTKGTAVRTAKQPTVAESDLEEDGDEDDSLSADDDDESDAGSAVGRASGAAPPNKKKKKKKKGKSRTKRA